MQKELRHSTQLQLTRLIIFALLFMMVGTAMELYLLNHFEDTLQLIPLICIGGSLLIFLILFFRQTKPLLVLFKLILGLTAASGLYGCFLHMKANFEFEQEMTPTGDTWDLLMESFSGALPALAPASMIVLSLIGYAYLILIKQKQ
ncbi:MAG: hypothetical protein AAFY71_02935 [Bacteroidota bacterium]